MKRSAAKGQAHFVQVVDVLDDVGLEAVGLKLRRAGEHGGQQHAAGGACVCVCVCVVVVGVGGDSAQARPRDASHKSNGPGHQQCPGSCQDMYTCRAKACVLLILH